MDIYYFPRYNDIAGWRRKTQCGFPRGCYFRKASAVNGATCLGVTAVHFVLWGEYVEHAKQGDQTLAVEDRPRHAQT